MGSYIDEKKEDRKEEFFTYLIDKIFDILKKHDFIYIGLLQSLLEEDESDYPLDEIEISVIRMKHAGVLYVIRSDEKNDYIFIDETARQTWEGWKKWKEELKNGALMPVKLNNQNFVKLQKELLNYAFNRNLKWLTFVIAASGLIVSVISLIL